MSATNFLNSHHRRIYQAPSGAFYSLKSDGKKVYSPKAVMYQSGRLITFSNTVPNKIRAGHKRISTDYLNSKKRRIFQGKSGSFFSQAENSNKKVYNPKAMYYKVGDGAVRRIASHNSVPNKIKSVRYRVSGSASPIRTRKVRKNKGVPRGSGPMNRLFKLLSKYESLLVRTNNGNYYITWFKDDKYYKVINWDTSASVWSGPKKDINKLFKEKQIKTFKIYRVDNRNREFEVTSPPSKNSKGSKK